MTEIATQIRYLTEVSTAARADARRLVREGRRVTELRQIHDQAEQLRKSFVLRYGIIGDSNAGKSRLIGGLLGKASALPVNPFPYTGNIAIVRVRSAAHLTSTTIGPYRLCFFSAEEACRCTAYLFDKFLEETRVLSGTEEAVRSGRELCQQITQEIPAAALLAWISKHWQHLVGQGVDVRLRLTELARFVLAWARLGAAVNAAKEVTVTQEVAEAAMVLPRSADLPTFAAFAAELDGLIVQGIGGAGPITALPQTLTPAFARAAYPLVRDIRIEATIPSAIWDLSELHVEAIELFDFPGLGAQVTSARDAYLSLQARAQGHIHTWVIVVNSVELKGSLAAEIINQLPPDRVIAVANRFDALPIWTDGHIEELDRLIAPEAPPRKQQEILGHLELLAPLTTLLGMSTRAERCVFVSAMLGLYELDRVAAVRESVLTVEQRRNWEHEVRRGQDVQPRWGRLARKIQAAEPDAALVGWLDTYSARDGQAGLKRLRQLLFEHANDVGLKQLADEMRGRLAVLNDTIRAFVIRIDQQIEESQANSDALRARLTELLDIFRDHTPPTNINTVEVRPNGPFTNGQLPASIRMMAPAGNVTKSLRAWVHDEVLMRVWSWSVWDVLFEAVGPDGMVECTAAKTSDGGAGPWSGTTKDEPARKASPWGGAGKKKPVPPLRAGEFHELFRQTYGLVEQVAVAGLRSALMDFLTTVAGRLAPLLSDLRPLARNSPENAVNFALDLLNEQNLAHFFETVCSTAPADSVLDGFWRYRFPYLVYPDDKEGGLALGPFLGWAPERRKSVRNFTQHQIYIARLRSELGTALEVGVVRQVATELAEFRARYQDLRDHLAEAVKNLHGLSNENLLALFGKGSGPQRPETQLDVRRIEYPYKSPN